MFMMLQLLAVFLVAALMGTTMAHILELSKKLRFAQDKRYMVETIYRRRFIVIEEALTLTIICTLLWLAPKTAVVFKWTLAGLCAVVAMQVIFWLARHTAKHCAYRTLQLVHATVSTFMRCPSKHNGIGHPVWNSHDNIWLCSHALRAIFAMIGLVMMMVAAVLKP
ncbi:MAG TPA: hypothetical protein VKZ53_04625 [Candidatus Angelobacter sp.]|nr:hypothetical protein [Candidatus Angelobacter sp.]